MGHSQGMKMGITCFNGQWRRKEKFPSWKGIKLYYYKVIGQFGFLKSSDIYKKI